MNTTHTKLIGFALLMTAVAGSAIAAEPGSTEADLLRGPQVVDASGPDGGDTMDGSAAKSKRAGDMPLRAYLGAVRGLNKAAKENPELALTDEQKEAIKEIGREHAEAMKAFREEHKEEFGAMGARGGEQGERGARGKQGKDRAEQGERAERGERGARDGQGDEMKERPSPEEMQRMREKMAELQSQAPSDQDAKKQLWAVLSADQQAVVKEHVETMRSKRQERVDQAMNRGERDEATKAESKGEAKRGQGKKGSEGRKGADRDRKDRPERKARDDD